MFTCFFPLQPRDDLGRQEVGADGDVGLIAVQELDEGNRVEPVERQAELLVLAGDVELVVEPAEHLGGVVDQVDVGLGVEVTKDVVGVLEHVEVLDLGGEPPDSAAPSRSRRPPGGVPPRRWRKGPALVPACRVSSRLVMSALYREFRPHQLTVKQVACLPLAGFAEASIFSRKRMQGISRLRQLYWQIMNAPEPIPMTGSTAEAAQDESAAALGAGLVRHFAGARALAAVRDHLPAARASSG